MKWKLCTLLDLCVWNETLCIKNKSTCSFENRILHQTSEHLIDYSTRQAVDAQRTDEIAALQNTIKDLQAQLREAVEAKNMMQMALTSGAFPQLMPGRHRWSPPRQRPGIPQSAISQAPVLWILKTQLDGYIFVFLPFFGATLRKIKFEKTKHGQMLGREINLARNIDLKQVLKKRKWM